MGIVAMDVARQHVRLDSDITDQDAALQLYLDAAEQATQDFLNRRVYADAAGFDAAKAALPAQWAAADAAYVQSVAAAQAVENTAVRAQALAAACAARDNARRAADAVVWGTVINPAIQAGILLTFGHLFLNREDVVIGTIATVLPIGARQILMPHRVQMGV